MISLPDQPLAERVLVRLLARERPPQQLLFFGPSGTGKRAAARAVAWLLVDPDGRHHPDEPALDITRLTGTGHLIRRPDLEPALADLATLPTIHRRRVLVIEEADRLDEREGASRLLKSLEEPPPHSHVILVTDHVEDMLPTVRSRCMPVPFRFPGWEAIEARLDPFAREIERMGVELGLAVLARSEAPARLVADIQRKMEDYARRHPSPELAELRAEAERLEGRRGGRTAAKRAEDQEKRELRRAVTDGWHHALDGFASITADALALGLGADAAVRHREHAAALRELVAADRTRALERTIEEVQLAQGALKLNPSTELAAEALLSRIAAIDTGHEWPLTASGRTPY